MLQNPTAAAVAAAASAEKKKRKEEKKARKLSAAAVAPDPDVVADGGGGKTGGKDRKLLLRSICGFLESSGFEKTLAVFRSEAEIPIDGEKASVLNLEDLFCKFLESRSSEDATTDLTKELDMKNLVPADDAHLKKNDKKKKRKPILNPDEENLEEEGSHGKTNTDREHDLLENDVNDKEKRKKKSKMSRDPSDGKPETGENGDFHELVEKKVEELKALSATPAADSNPKSSGEKRKKTKRSPDASAGNAVELETEAFQEGITKKSRESVTVETSMKDVLVNSDSKSKEKKKKKDKTKTEDGNAVELETEAFQEGIKKKSKESVTLETSIKDVLVNADSKSKDKKKKKDKTKTEDGETSHDAGAGDATASIKDVSEEINNNSKKSKKRKNLASEERASEPENVVEAKDSKLARLEGAEDTTVSKKQKKEKSYENSSETVKTSYNPNIDLLTEHKESPGSCDSPKQSKEHLLANGDLEKESEGGTSSKMLKKEKHSAEPTTNSFRRVKLEEVEFVDERLQNNSYWAKGGADSGYGAKAQEILGQVRGRDFRHEKTKKKRGSYRGGQIDLQSHSIKFNYSDEE